MSIQSATTVDIRYAQEPSYGVSPNGAFKSIEKVSSSLTMSKDTYQSQRIRSDRQIAYFRHGVRRVEGDVVDELAIASQDDFIEAVMAGTWSNGTSYTGATLVDSVDNSIARADSNPFTGFEVGDIIETAGYVNAANNGKFRIVSIDNGIIFVDGALVDEAGAGTESVTVLGKKVKNGTVQRSFTFEMHSPEIAGDAYEVFSGVRFNTFAVSLPPTGLAQATFGLVGKDMSILPVPQSGSVVPPVSGSLLAAVNGVAYVDGVAVALLTQLDLNLENGITGEAVVGSNTIPHMTYGRSNVTGSFTAMLESMDFIEAFRDEAEISIEVQLDGDDGVSFMKFTAPKVKLGSAAKTIQGEGVVTVQCDFQALLDTDLGASLIIQTFSL